MAARVAQILHRLPALRTLGFAVEFFPRYVNRTLHPHAVDVVLMTVIVRGRGQHVMGGRVYEERTGSVGITHYGQEHDVLTTRAGMDIYNVYLDLQHHALPSLPAELQPIAPLILPLHPQFRNELNRSVHFHVSEPMKFAAMLRRIMDEMAARPPGYEEVARACLRLFLVDCCREAMRSGIEVARPVNGAFPAWLERLRTRLDSEYAMRHSLGRLAAEARVSRSHLCRVFKQYTGKRVFEYLVERRIEAAMLRLRSTSDKIVSIAMESGFNDLAYFNRTFRRTVGMTPKAYRSQARR